MSNKLPYFRWHPKDFDTDENVRLMTMCEVGLYVLCLNHAWINGSLPDDVKKIAKIVGQPLAKVKRSWVAVSKCFEKNSDGNFINSRQEKEREWAREKKDQALESNKLRHGKSTKTSDQKHDVYGVPRASGSESDSGSPELETASVENVSTRAQTNSEEIYPEDPVEVFYPQAATRERAPFAVKLTRKSDEQIRSRLEETQRKHGLADVRLAWLAFIAWAKAERPELDSPVGYFLASLERFLTAGTPPAPPVDIPPPRVAPIGPSAPECVPLAVWNSKSNLPPYEKHGALSAAVSRDEKICLEQPMFVERIDEICNLAASAHRNRAGEVDYLNYAWLLRNGDKGFGWFRLLTDLRWMTEASDQHKAKPQGVDGFQNAIKELTNGKQQREHDLGDR